ncbi:MAG: type II toxin-antitoxin system HicA family toxin [Pedosphaera sp.]|nr:type II toxin-antitoxin system HicA family toxin [Pedosphaera sp.]
MPRPHKPDDVFRILREYDSRFVVLVNRGKGSHRMIFHPNIKGQKRSFPIPYHRGKEIQRGLLKALIRRFNLPNNLFG